MSKEQIQLQSSRLRGAFTLIELMVVMVILAILAGIVLPTVMSTTGMQATSGARVIAADLQYAQNVAITHQQSITVTFVPGTDSYSLSNASGPLIHPITKEAYTVGFGAGNEFENLDLVTTNLTNHKVTFDSMGVPNNSGTVEIKAGSTEYDITIAPATGKITVSQSSS